MEIFRVIVGSQFLLSSPLHGLTAVVNQSALQETGESLRGVRQPSGATAALVAELRAPGRPRPRVKEGELKQPFFLGILPTRGCNLNCSYCDFPAPKKSSPLMSRQTAKAAVDSYLELARKWSLGEIEIHFFGGEPLCHPEIVRYIVDYARYQSAQLDLHIKFELITNGVYSEFWARWAAEHIDRIVLSLDGPEDIQERHRPALGGKPYFAQLERNARIFAEARCELDLRGCVTGLSVQRMEETAAWMAEQFHPARICFETLVETPRSRAAGLSRPDPFEFARHFIQTAAILNEYGIHAVHSTTEIQMCQESFCPLGQDAIIVSPDGLLSACYLLEEDWQRRGVDLSFGRLAQGGFQIDQEALQKVRDFAAREKPLCANCFCRYHCAGGCHVNHLTGGPAGAYDDQCIQTRLISAARLLEQCGQTDLLNDWASNATNMRITALQDSDRLIL